MLLEAARICEYLANEMAQSAKVLATKRDDPRLTPGPTCWKERTDPHELSSFTHVLCGTYPTPQKCY